MEKKLLMPLSEFNHRVSAALDAIKLQIYIRGVKKQPGVGFGFLDFEEEVIREKREFLDTIRVLIEKEIKRYYDIVPDWE